MDAGLLLVLPAHDLSIADGIVHSSTLRERPVMVSSDMVSNYIHKEQGLNKMCLQRTCFMMYQFW
jgi:hypothetical protein